MKLAVFVFYDEDGILDDYIQYYLCRLRDVVERLVVVVNGDVNEAGMDYLKGLTDDVIVRENVGYDAWAYKTGIEYVGFEAVANFDEVILCNATVFGPLSALEDVFAVMGEKDVGFWGITRYYADGHLPDHIQSYFVAFRQTLIRSKWFLYFWENLSEISTYDEAVNHFEIKLTAFFAEHGFEWDTFIPEEAYLGRSFFPLITHMDEIVERYGCPFIKRKSFFCDYNYVLYYSSGFQLRKILGYLKSEHTYPIRLIYDHLIRTCALSDLKNTLGLRFLLEEDRLALRGEMLAMVIFVAEERDLAWLGDFQEGMNGFDRIFLMGVETSLEWGGYFCEAVQAKIVVIDAEEEASVQTLEDVFEEEDEWVVYFLNLAIVDQEPSVVLESYFEYVFENNLKSEETVRSIAGIFAEEKHIGLLSEAPMYHANHYKYLNCGWGGLRQDVFELLGMFDVEMESRLNSIYDEHRSMFVNAGSVWFRRGALGRDDFWQLVALLGKKLVYSNEVNALDWVLSIVGQGHGFYSGWFNRKAFVELTMNNYGYMLEGLNQVLDFNTDFNGLVNALAIEKLVRVLLHPLVILEKLFLRFMPITIKMKMKKLIGKIVRLLN